MSNLIERHKVVNNFKISVHMRENFKSENSLTTTSLNNQQIMLKNSLDLADMSMFGTNDESSRQEKSEQEDTILHSMHKKTLKDYDKELKGLKEENFDLKLRIYLLEEKLADYEMIVKNNDKLSELLATTTNETINNTNKKYNRKKNSVYDYSESEYSEESDDSLNDTTTNMSKYFHPVHQSINYAETNKELKDQIDQLTDKLNIREQENETNMSKYNELKKEYDKLVNDINKKLKEFHLREQDYKRNIDECEANLEQKQKQLNEKTIEFEHLKKQQIDLVKTYKNEAVCQMETLMQKLIAKENLINNLQNDLNNCNQKIQVNSNTNYNVDKQIDDKLNFIATFKKHYEILIQDLENQLKLKETLIQKYITLLNDKDKQVNSLIEANLFTNHQETNRQNIDLLVSQLKSNLADKERILNDNFVLLKQKDDLILNLKLNLNQYSIDLSKANQIILDCENKIITLYNEILHLDTMNKSLQNLVVETTNNNNSNNNNNQELKNSFIFKMKEAIKSTTQENDMLKFYEEQLSDRDFTISELTTKLKKINEKVSQSFTDDEKSIEIKQLKLELEQVKLKLKEKENSIKKLILSAEQKDSLIVKLKSNDLRTINKSFSSSTDETSLAEREDIRKRKIQGLLKVIQEKNQQIDLLKTEINETRLLSNKTGSLSDLNSSSCNSINNLSNHQLITNNRSIKAVVELLEKEIEIYQKLNSKKFNTDLENNMQEIIKLRNELLKSTFTLKDYKTTNRSATPSSSSSGPDLDDNKSSIMSFVSPRTTPTNWRLDSMPDSGVSSDKSDISDSNKINKLKLHHHNLIQLQESSTSVSRSTTSNSIATTNLSPSSSYSSINVQSNLKLKSQDDLIALVQQITNENQSLKQRIEPRTPKVTEMHNELIKVREKLESAERLNDYLRKQIEIFHIAHGNHDLLLELAHKLDLTKDELEQYKEKMARIQDLNDSLPLNSIRLSAILKKSESISNLNNNNNNNNANSDMPTRNIKITVTTLENKLEELKLKYRWLQDMYNNSENACRYFAIKFNKYNHFLAPSSNTRLRRSSSCPNVTHLQEGNQLKSLFKKYLVDFKETCPSSPSKSESSFSSSPNTNQTKENDYLKKLLFIYQCFKHLKSNQKYLKQLFGDQLIDLFERENNKLDLNTDNPVHNMFSNAFHKFDEINKQLEKKDEQIKSLQIKLDTDLKQNIPSNYNLVKDDELNKLKDCLTRNKIYLADLKDKLQKGFVKNVNEKLFCDFIEKSQCELNKSELVLKSSILKSLSSIKNEETINQNNEMKNKLRKYKDEVNRLREKIKSQNKDIEDALKLLAQTNKEKENIKLFVSNAYMDEKLLENEMKETCNEYLSDKLMKSHLKLNKAIDNIEKKLNNNNN